MSSSPFYGRVKSGLKEFIGYDEDVAEAAQLPSFKYLTRNVGGRSKDYLSRLFPFTRWLPHYNLTWAAGDLIAGLTVGIIVVPQGMSYARIATLPPEYGLYSSFIGVCIYALFATSKDVTIGPVAVMSLEVAKVIAHVQAQTDAFTASEIATALAFVCGIVVLGVGLLRLGWLIEFIPAPAVSGFMTGSAISIATGQVASLMGYSSKFDTRAATYKVIINSFKHLPDTKIDAAFGLSGLVFLYVVRYVSGRIERRARNPRTKRIAFFANTLRSAFVIIFLTLFSWVYLRNKSAKNYPMSILKTVPSGFQHVGQPNINTDLLSRLGPLIPVSTIILLLEHIAIAKSFGRINNYKIDPNQELIAIGVTNLVGTLFAAYPATGSFSRSAVNSKAGVRTPLAGWITGSVVIVALYALTGAFYWIPNAALSAVIIHAVIDLIASPSQVYNFWKVSPYEAFIWFGAVILSVFVSIEVGIYFSVGASLLLLLVRIARPRGHFLGRVRVQPELEDPSEAGTLKDPRQRDVFLPLQPDGIRNPRIKVEPPPPGVIIFRFDEAMLYPNASYYADVVLAHAKKHTRAGYNIRAIKKGDRPWNDPGPMKWGKKKTDDPVGSPGASDAGGEQPQKPILRAVVFDFSSVSNLDSTSIQNLVDLRRVLERYAGGEVQFHFAMILSPWIKRALLAGGFGTGKIVDERPLEIAPVVPSGAEPVPSNFQRRFPNTPISSPPNGKVREASSDLSSSDPELGLGHSELKTADGVQSTQQMWSDTASATDLGPIVSTKHKRFHVDLSSAVNAAAGTSDW